MKLSLLGALALVVGCAHAPVQNPEGGGHVGDAGGGLIIFGDSATAPTTVPLWIPADVRSESFTPVPNDVVILTDGGAWTDVVRHYTSVTEDPLYGIVERQQTFYGRVADDGAADLSCGDVELHWRWPDHVHPGRQVTYPGGACDPCLVGCEHLVILDRYDRDDLMRSDAGNAILGAIEACITRHCPDARKEVTP